MHTHTQTDKNPQLYIYVHITVVLFFSFFLVIKMQKISYRFIPKRYPLSCLILRSKRSYGYFNWDIQKRWSSSTGVLPTNRPSLHIPLHQQCNYATGF